MRLKFLLLLALLASGTLLSRWTSSGPEKVRILSVSDKGWLRISGDRRVRLQGLALSEQGRTGPRSELLAALRQLSTRGPFRLELDAHPGGDYATLRQEKGGKSVNEEILEKGLAWFTSQSARVTDQARLLAAGRRAKSAGAGLWKGVQRLEGRPPIQRGAVLGLYYKEERFDYHEQIDRVVASGAEWLTLLVSNFVDKVDSSEVEFDAQRTVKASRFLETAAYARKKGLRLALLPIVLIRHAGDDDWRGTLKPKDVGRFWLSYNRFLMHWTDLARRSGVDLLYVGSEFCSLERNQKAWERIIANARGRFGGWLTYSVNWDHYSVPRFWHLLDQVGMTAYFELTKDKDASYDKLVSAWRKVRKDLAKASKDLSRPLVLTELGYPSQNGANTAPWNYYLAQNDIDLEEQADCFRAFAEVMHDAPFLSGVYIFDFFEKGGPEDHTYAIWKKPAWKVVQKFLATFRR